MDELEITVTPSEVPDRQTYTVVAESGLFKNGKQYAKGDKIELDSVTADSFKKLEEIK